MTLRRVRKGVHVGYKPNKEPKSLDKQGRDAHLSTEARRKVVSKDDQENISPRNDTGVQRVRKGALCSSSASKEDVSVPDNKLGGRDTSQAPLGADLGGPVTVAEPLFPGFVETEFSTAKSRYFYQGSKSDSVVGVGAFATVYKVHWLNPVTGELELQIAKSLEMEKAAEHPGGPAGWEADLSRELAALECLRGVPGVVQLRQLIKEPNGAVHIILKRVHGVTLNARLTYRHSPKAGLSWLQLRCVLLQIAQVLVECHERGVVHGDLKLDNVMNAIDKSSITLVDLGSASLLRDSRYQYNGGTKAYAAPELLLKARSNCARDAPACFSIYGPFADMWAYGLLALQLLTGCCLFDVDVRARPSDIFPHTDESRAWAWTYIADLHQEWEGNLEPSAVHATFNQKMEQLAGASLDYQREGIAFLRGLLHPDPVNRMTAKEAVHHPFLIGSFPDVAPDLLPPELEEEEEVVVQSTLGRMLEEAMAKRHGAE